MPKTYTAGALACLTKILKTNKNRKKHQMRATT